MSVICIVPCSLYIYLFQELLELAQRKFLRQLILYTDDISVSVHGPYPRLIIVDFDDSSEVCKTGEHGKRKHMYTYIVVSLMQ